MRKKLFRFGLILLLLFGIWSIYHFYFKDTTPLNFRLIKKIPANDVVFHTNLENVISLMHHFSENDTNETSLSLVEKELLSAGLHTDTMYISGKWKTQISLFMGIRNHHLFQQLLEEWKTQFELQQKAENPTVFTTKNNSIQLIVYPNYIRVVCSLNSNSLTNLSREKPLDRLQINSLKHQNSGIILMQKKKMLNYGKIAFQQKNDTSWSIHLTSPYKLPELQVNDSIYLYDLTEFTTLIYANINPTHYTKWLPHFLVQDMLKNPKDYSKNKKFLQSNWKGQFSYSLGGMLPIKSVHYKSSFDENFNRILEEIITIDSVKGIGAYVYAGQPHRFLSHLVEWIQTDTITKQTAENPLQVDAKEEALYFYSKKIGFKHQPTHKLLYICRKKSGKTEEFSLYQRDEYSIQLEYKGSSFFELFDYLKLQAFASLP